MDILTVKTFELFAQACTSSFFGLPAWYKYLDPQPGDTRCVPILDGLSDIWLVGLAVIEFLIRLALYIGIAYVIYAGLKYSESRGNVEKAATAKNTLIDAITGVVIAMIAVALISFAGGRFAQ